jgi:hypothetical protein
MKRVTIIIPTRNRYPVLLETLNKLRGFNDSAMEVLVYDDCSDEDNITRLRDSFPAETFIFNRSEIQVGPCELRNRMIQSASAELIVGLDDDSCFVAREDYECAISLMPDYPDAGIIGFMVLEKNKVLFPEFKVRGNLRTSIFCAGGFIAKKQVLLEAGVFDSLFFRAGEERDLAIRLMAKGRHIYATSEVRVFHQKANSARDPELIEGYAFRNGLFFYLKYFSGIYLLYYLFRHFFMHTFYCLGRGWLRALRFGIGSFIQEYKVIARIRMPVKRETLKEYINLRRGM